VTTFRRIVLPAILPAMLSGAALAFGRAMGEYGSVVLISGQLERRTEIASLYIYKQIQDDALPEAAATATVLLIISVIVMSAIAGLRTVAARRG
jgi:sulfate transport system permease protein